jgi:lipopolysaccharide assembly protein A
MRFLKILLWAVLAIALVLFAARNWTPVTVNLWNGIVLDTWLPLMLGLAFLLGLLPVLILHRTTRWSLRRRLDSVEKTFADYRASTPVAPPAPPPVPEVPLP